MTTTSSQWLEVFSARLGVETPGAQLCQEILALASSAAHASERTAAPVACWLAASAGLSPSEALKLAQEIDDLGSSASVE